MNTWVEILVATPDDAAEDLAAELAARVPAAAAGTELRAGAIVFWADAAAEEDALLATRAAVAALGRDPADVHAQPAVPESEWRDAWKRYFKVSRVTRRLVIVPSWESYAAAGNDVVLDLDPGQAFGTGTHASTRLCLSELDDLDAVGERPPRLLDLGTGSGILAIAAAKLWPATTALAIDNDPIAVRVAQENCERNRVLDRVTCTADPVEQLDERFPLVLANIQAHVHLSLREAIAERVAPGGTLVLSGLLSEQAEPVAAAFVDAGLVTERVRVSDDDPAWSSVRLRRERA